MTTDAPLNNGVTPSSQTGPDRAANDPALTPAGRPLHVRRRPDLTLAAEPLGGEIRPVDRLIVREISGIGRMFTPNLEQAYQFRGIAHKPPGSFETAYQIVAGAAGTDPLIAPLVRGIAFVPVLDWGSRDVVLRPVKMTTHGQYVIADLRTLQARFPGYKCYVVWDNAKRRHVVRWQDTNEAETEIVRAVDWPDVEVITEALASDAYDSVDMLAEVNEDVRALVNSREVR